MRESVVVRKSIGFHYFQDSINKDSGLVNILRPCVEYYLLLQHNGYCQSLDQGRFIKHGVCDTQQDNDMKYYSQGSRGRNQSLVKENYEQQSSQQMWFVINFHDKLGVEIRIVILILLNHFCILRMLG